VTHGALRRLLICAWLLVVASGVFLFFFRRDTLHNALSDACGVFRVRFWKCLVGVAIGEGAICGIYIFLGDSLLRTMGWR
jgi:hypothetical protein